MGNLYTDNLIGTVIGLSVADDWEGARREWRIVGCEVDETHSATCVCGKEGLRYVYTIANTETGETLSPIGSSCIKKFEQSDMDEELAGWQQAIKLMEEAARIGKEDYVHLHSGSYSRKLLYFLYEQDAFRPTKYNGYDGYNDYLFLLDMFNGGFCSEAQERKCQAIIMLENEDWGDEFALMEERWCSGFPYFRECLAKLLKLGYVRESVNRSGYPSSYLISAKACLEDGESNGYDKENPKIPDWYWNVWDDYDCWSNSLNGNEITYRFLRKRGCPAYLAKTIASK